MKVSKKLLAILGISMLSVGYTYAHNTIYFGIVNNTDGVLTFRQDAPDNFDFKGGDLSPSIPPGGKLNAQGDEEGTVWNSSSGSIIVFKDGDYYAEIRFYADDNVNPSDIWYDYPVGYFPVCHDANFLGDTVSCNVVKDTYHRLAVGTLGGAIVTRLSETDATEGSTHSYVDISIQGTSQTPPSGSWIHSCKNYTYSADNGRLEADCNKQYGYTNHSTLNYRNMCLRDSTVSNISGVLTCDSPAPAGSYQQSCLDPKVDTDTGTLMAFCADYRGYYGATSLPNFQQCKWGIENDGGNLRCMPQPISAMSMTIKTMPNVLGSKITPSQLHLQSVKPW
ncbi:MAG: hypothetical protein E6Q33_04570 [Neisseriales bacterium]|nr:MAG: hypothetical protein E6Q33_04570 [Neisseriales bacterium]